MVESGYGFDDGSERFPRDILVGLGWAELRGQAVGGMPPVVRTAGVDHGFVRRSLAAGKRQEIFLDDAF